MHACGAGGTGTPGQKQVFSLRVGQRAKVILMLPTGHSYREIRQEIAAPIVISSAADRALGFSAWRGWTLVIPVPSTADESRRLNRESRN
jgi:uncharacterized protein YerC